jgi:hypothetical protein
MTFQEAHMKGTFVATALALAIFPWAAFECGAQTTPQALPNPVLYLMYHEYYLTPAGSFVRYRYGVFNSSAYPDELFSAAPSLPPCGVNANSSRTWVDLFDQRGKRLYGFCALRPSDKLNSIWFALPEGVIPPSWVYIELNDRKTGTKYKSNLAETTQ